MPQLQVVDFGESPSATNFGAFANGFSDSFFKAQKQKRNDDIFESIKAKYGQDSDPLKMLEHVITAENLDDDYRDNKFNQILDYAKLKSTIDDKQKRLDKKQDNFKNVNSYVKNLLSDQGDAFNPTQEALITQYTQEFIEDGLDNFEAFQAGYEKYRGRQKIVYESPVIEKPNVWPGAGLWGGATENDVAKAFVSTLEALSNLYDLGITTRSELRDYARRGKWDEKEVNKLLDELMVSKGKKPSADYQPFDLQQTSQSPQPGSPYPDAQQQQSLAENVPETPAEKLVQVSDQISQDHTEKNKNGRYFESYKAGLEASTSGELQKFVSGNHQTQNIIEDPDFFEQLVHFAGEFTGDAPYIAAGTALGAAVGASGGPPGIIAGGGAGSLALPAFIKTALQEYRDYVAKGNDLTFGEFLERAGRVGSTTLREGAFGVILGSISKAIPFLSKIPGIGKIFTTKIGQKTAEVGLETAAVATIPAATEGRLPEGKDFAHALALVMGFQALKIPGKIREKINKAGEKSGLTPKEFLENPEAQKKVLEDHEIQQAIDGLKKMKKMEVDRIVKNTVDEINAKEAVEQEKVTKKENLHRQKEKIKTPEKPIRNIKEREIEKTDKSEEKIQTDLKDTQAELENIPKGNKKNLAKEAIKRGDVRTPEQLRLFLDEYESTYSGLPGKTGRDKNRKFLNRYASKNVHKRKIEHVKGKPIVSVKPSLERQIEIAATKIREAKASGDKAKLKEANRDLDLLKRKQKNLEKQKKKPSKESNEKPTEKVETKAEVAKEYKPEVKESPKGEEGVTFTTKKGSTYVVGEKGSTTRNKKFRPEHGEKEQGPQTPSEKTIYVDESGLDKLGFFQAEGEGSKRVHISEDKAGVVFTSGKHKGKMASTSLTGIHTEPEVGLYPVELWDNGTKVHFGNIITEVNKPTAKENVKPQKRSPTKRAFEALSALNEAESVSAIENNISSLEKKIKKAQEKSNKSLIRILSKNLALQRDKLKKKKSAKPKKPPEPIIETTGQGAEEQTAYPKTTKEKVTEKAQSVIEVAKNPTELLHEVNTKMFDALIPLERLEKDIPISERVTTRVKQAQSAASEANNVLTQGIFDNVSGQYVGGSLKDVYHSIPGLWTKLTKGLKPNEYSLKEFDSYRTSKEALKRQKVGKKSGIDTAKAKETVERLKHKYEPLYQRLNKFQNEVVAHYGKDLLTPEMRKQWSENTHTSLYRAMDTGKGSIAKEGSLAPKQPYFKTKKQGSTRKILPASESDPLNLSMMVSNARKNEAMIQYKHLVEQGKLPGRVKKSKNRAAPESFLKQLEESEFDSSSKELADALYDQSRKDAWTTENGTLKGWENGEPFEIEVPKDVFDTFSSLAPQDTGFFTNIFKKAKEWFSKGVVMEPIKALSITSRDVLNGVVLGKYNHSPFNTAKAFFDILNQTDQYSRYKALGGDTYASRLLARSERITKVESLLKKERPNAIIVPFQKLGKYLREFNGMVSAAVPFAEYQAALKKFGDTPQGRLQALMEAKSVSYDPTKKGSHKVIKGLGNVGPFFNVMLQEPYIIAKNIKRPLYWAKGMAYYGMPAMLMKMYNTGNPDYDDLSPISKAMFYHFYLPGDIHVAVPLGWLNTALFKLPTELAYDVVNQEGGDSLKGMIAYITSQISGAFNPIVQVAVEQTTGKSLETPLGMVTSVFTNQRRAPDVVPKRLQNLPPEKQYTSKTTLAARWWGELWGVSPVKTERFIKGFGGGVAMDALYLVDEIAYRTGLVEDNRPDDIIIIGRVVQDSTPTNTKYTQRFYQMLDEEKLKDQRGQPSKIKTLNRYNKQVSDAFKQYRDIEKSKIDPKIKKQKLKQSQQKINRLFKQAVKETDK